MVGFRPAGGRGTGVPVELIQPGDIMLGGESYSAGAVTVVGAATLSGAQMATGIIERSGSSTTFGDTSDSAANIIAAMAGNSAADVVAGSTFRLTYVNNTGQAMATLTGGAGVVLGSGTLTTASAKLNEYLVTVLNASPQVAVNSTFLTTSKILTFVLPPGMNALTIGPNPPAYNITPGMSASGTNIASGSLVAGITMGQGGIIGVTLDTNTTGTSATGGTVVTFTPTVRIDSLYTCTL